MSSPARRGNLDPAELDGKLAAGLARNEHAKDQLDRLERLAGSDAGLLCSDAVRAGLDAIRAELAESSDQISSARAAYRDYLAELFTQSILAPPPAAPDVPRQRSRRKPHTARQNPLMRLVDGGTDRLRGVAFPAAFTTVALHLPGLHLGVSRATALKLAGGAAALAVSAGTVGVVQHVTDPPPSHHQAVFAPPRGAAVQAATPIPASITAPVVAASVIRKRRAGKHPASSSPPLVLPPPASPSQIPPSASQGPAEGHLVIPVTSIVASPAGTAAVNLDASSDGPVPWGMVCRGAACSDLSFSVTHGEIPAGMASYTDFTVDQAGQAAGGTVTLLFSGGTTRNLPVTVSWQAVPQAQPSVTASPVVTVMPAG